LTEQEKYAFDLGRAYRLGRLEATWVKVLETKKSSKTARECNKIFILYKDSREKLKVLHLIYEVGYEEFFNPDRVTMPKKLKTTISNLPGFLLDLGQAYEDGVFNAYLDKTPQRSRLEREDLYPFASYKNSPDALEQLHGAFEWGYIDGKPHHLRKNYFLP